MDISHISLLILFSFLCSFQKIVYRINRPNNHTISLCKTQFCWIIFHAIHMFFFLFFNREKSSYAQFSIILANTCHTVFFTNALFTYSLHTQNSRHSFSAFETLTRVFFFACGLSVFGEVFMKHTYMRNRLVSENKKEIFKKLK